MVYLIMMKSLYGCMDSTLLWYNLYVKKIKSLGLVIDPYGRCILIGYRIVYGTRVLYDYTRFS